MARFGFGKVLLTVAAVAAVGGSLFVWKAHEANVAQALKAKEQAARTERRLAETRALEAEKATAQENAKAKEAVARTEEARKARAADERAAAEAKAAEKKAAAEAERTKLEAAKAETAKAKAQKEAAEAEAKKAKAQKEAAEAAAAELAKKTEAATLALKKAEAERQKADADYATAAAVKRAAEAAREKSENDRKAAEANAAAEHDRKLRMYQRAGTSRAELLALKRAEKLLALEESGALARAEADVAAEAEVEPAAAEAPAEETRSATNAAVAVTWPAEDGVRPADEAVAQQLDEIAGNRRRRRARAYIERFTELADAAEREKPQRAPDAARARATIPTLVPDYVDVYEELIRESCASGRVETAQKHIRDLFKVVPEWERVDVVVRLLKRDETFYSRELAGRVPKTTYVAGFRKLYDLARRDLDSDGEDGRDPREERMQHIREVLSKYVPDYEKIYEWSGTYSVGKDD